MFNLFKRKNEMKELKCRVVALESQVTVLNSQKEKGIDFSKSWGEEFNLKGCIFKGIEIKDTKFMDELAKKVSNIIEKNKESQISITILNTDGVEVLKSVSGNLRIENVSPKVNKIIHKIKSQEGNETTVTFDKECITLSVNEAKSKEESKINVDLILQIDGNVIWKIALNQLGKMQRQEKSKLYIKEEFKGLDNYEITKK